MNLTRLALENYRVTQVVVVLVVLGGILSYLSLPRAEDPGFVMRTAQVTTLMPADPRAGLRRERVEDRRVGRLGQHP
jgi:multidrug efflux pump subunit AcrB